MQSEQNLAKQAIRLGVIAAGLTAAIFSATPSFATGLPEISLVEEGATSAQKANSKPVISLVGSSQTTQKDSKEAGQVQLSGVAPAARDDSYGSQMLFPELPTTASVSSIDVNRIVCRSDIQEVVYSKEKGMKVQTAGKNLFVKFLAAKTPEGEIRYATTPVEAYIMCGGSTYNVILVPKRITAQTIRLSSDKSEKVQANNNIFAGQSFEKKVQSLIRTAYSGEYPDSFAITENDKDVKVYAEVKTVLKRTVHVEGEGLVLKEYAAIPKVALEASEKLFLRKEYSLNPLAVALDKLNLRAGEPFRVFIIERHTGDGGAF